MATRQPKIEPANNLDFSLLPQVDHMPRFTQNSGSDSLLPDEPTPIEPGKTLKGRGVRMSKIASQASIDLHLEKLKARAASNSGRDKSSIEQRVLQEVLPLWDDSNRGVPNPFIRSGLFSVKNTVKREFMEEMHIDSLSNYDVSYSGRELQQDDLSVWMSLINLARNQPMTDKVYFSGYQLIKDLGWRMHSESYKKAQESIKRLKVTGVQISTNNHTNSYSGSLIRDYGWAEMDESGNAKWMIRFEPTVSSLFLEDTTTLLEWETRKKIGTRATVALYLHSFYSSHRDPIPLPLHKLFVLSRSGGKLSDFRRSVKNAMEILVKLEFLEGYSLENDVVRVVKKSQSRMPRIERQAPKVALKKV